MARIIAAMNMTLDGFCDHTAMTADDEIHDHYTELLKNAGTILYGRKTYELMTYWQDLINKPSGNRSMDEFAAAIDNIQKIVYSRTVQEVNWRNTILKNEFTREEIIKLRQEENENILVGSPGLILALTKLHLIDEYQLGIQPVILGNGLQLFKNIQDRIDLTLVKTKTFGCGAVFLYYTRNEK